MKLPIDVDRLETRRRDVKVTIQAIQTPGIVSNYTPWKLTVM